MTTPDCERAAEAALALDSAEAVEELVAGTFAPSLYDLLTGSAENGSGDSEPPTDTQMRSPMNTIPDGPRDDSQGG